MGYTAPVQLAYGARTFSTHINNGANTFFVHFMHYCLHWILFVLITNIGRSNILLGKKTNGVSRLKTNLWQAAKINLLKSVSEILSC